MFIKEFELAKSVAAKTAKMLQKIYISDVKIISSKGKDIKTEADYAAHKLIIDSLSHTDIPIVSEEGDYQEFNIHDSQWIIDPIDGTYNLSRGFSEAAVSISLWDGGLPVFGVIHPQLPFRFGKGGGATYCRTGNMSGKLYQIQIADGAESLEGGLGTGRGIAINDTGDGVSNQAPS